MQSDLVQRVQLQHSGETLFKSRSRREQREHSLQELLHKAGVQLQSDRIRFKPN